MHPCIIWAIIRKDFLDIGIILVITIVFLAISALAFRRQSAVLAVK
jgi:hypothetical protein